MTQAAEANPDWEVSSIPNDLDTPQEQWRMQRELAAKRAPETANYTNVADILVNQRRG